MEMPRNLASKVLPIRNHRVPELSASEPAALRADHTALPRFLAEMEALTKHAPAMER
jgi:hypothetical protein